MILQDDAEGFLNVQVPNGSRVQNDSSSTVTGAAIQYSASLTPTHSLSSNCNKNG